MHGLKPRLKATPAEQPRLGLKSFRNGGPISGPGTGTSDSIQMTMPEGSYVMPADSSQALGHENLMQMGNSQSGVPVAVSNGEHELPPEQVHAIGVQALDQMKAATHQPVGGLPKQQPQEPQRYFANGGQVGGFGLLRRATGGVVSEDERQRQNTSVAGAPGVQRTGNSYADAPRPAAEPVPARTPSWSNRISFPASKDPNYQPSQTSPAPAPQAVGLPQSKQIENKMLVGPPSSEREANQQRLLMNQARAAENNERYDNFGAAAAADARQAAAQRMNRSYGARQLGAITAPTPSVSEGALAEYDRVNPAKFGAEQTSAPQTATPNSFAQLTQNNERMAQNMLGINGITKSSRAGVGVTGPLKQADLMARTPGTGRGFAPGAQASPSAPQEQATIPYMADGRRGKTNAEVGAENPAGRVQMVRQPNGTMSFSGTDVHGPVSYTDGQGQPLAGGGLRGRGFSSVDTVASNAMGAAQGRQSSGQALSAARDAAAQRGDWDGVAQSYASQGRGFDGRSPAQIQAGLNRPATIVDAPRLGFTTRAERSEQLRQQRMQDAMRDGNMANAQRSALADIYRSDNNLREASVRGANEMARAQMEQQAATQRQENSNTASLTEVAMREAGQTQRAQPEAQLGLRTMALREAEAGDASKIRGFEIEHAQRLQGLRTQYAAAKNDTERASIARQIQELSGNARPQNENLSNSFMAVGGGQEWNQEAGIMRNVPQKLIDLRTGQEVGGVQQGLQPPEHQINFLRKNPSKDVRLEFDEIYGAGAAARILGA